MAHRDTTIIFVPGAWHSPNCFNQVITYLHDAGYNTAKVWTPSVLRDGAPPIQTFDPDVAEIRKHLELAVNAGQKVVLVMHSYGGLPGSQAVEGYDQASLAARGHQDGRGVVHLFYIAAAMLRAGEAWASVPEAIADFVDISKDGNLVAKTPVETFYHDIQSKVLVDGLVADLNPWSEKPRLSILSYEPWKILPTTYLACEYDRAIPFSNHKWFVRNAIDAGAVDMRMITWKCGHSPFLVKPLEFTQLVRAAAGDVQS